jgi:hypothetical protein
MGEWRLCARAVVGASVLGINSLRRKTLVALDLGQWAVVVGASIREQSEDWAVIRILWGTSGRRKDIAATDDLDRGRRHLVHLISLEGKMNGMGTHVANR